MNFSCSQKATEDLCSIGRLMKPKQLGFSLLTEQLRHDSLSLASLYSSPLQGTFTAGCC